jgi:ACT domain-containing protein
MESLEAQPWYVQVSAILTLAILVSTVMRVIVWPFFKKIWQFIISAPRLADNVGKLVDLLEIDILHKVEVLEIKQELNEQHTANIESRTSGLTARVDAHDKRADAYEMRVNILETRLAQLEGRIHELSSASN